MKLSREHLRAMIIREMHMLSEAATPDIVDDETLKSTEPEESQAKPVTSINTLLSDIANNADYGRIVTALRTLADEMDKAEKANMSDALSQVRIVLSRLVKKGASEA
jgi:hypothetical protein